MSSKKVLVADDDQDVKESIQVMLMHYGYTVIVASNGKEAVEEYKKNEPDITFLDINMPEMDGYDAFFKIREINPKAKIVFITGFTIEGTRYEEVKKKNLLATLYKPVGLDQLLKILRKSS